jgi:MFS family permease
MILGLDRNQFRNFSLIIASSFLFFCNFSSFFLLPLFIKSLGGNERNIGFVMGSFGITSIGSIPLVSYLLDKYGRRKFLMLGSLVMSFSSFGFFFIRDLSPFLYVFRLLQGIGFAFFFTSSATAVVDVIPESRRGQGLGIFGAFIIMTYAVGPSISEFIINKFGFGLFFIITSSFSLVATFVVFPARDVAFERATDTSALRFFYLAFSKRYFVLLLTNVIAASGFGSVLYFIAVYVKSKGLNVSYFFVTYTITVAALRILGGRISDVFGRKGVASPSLFLFSLAIASVALINSVFMIVLVSVLFSFGYGMLYPTLSALVVDKSWPDERGRAMGAYNASFSMGVNFPTFAFGIIAENWGFVDMYLISAFIVFIGFTIFTFFEAKQYA